MITPMEQKYAKEVGELHYRYIRSLLRDLGKRMCITFYGNALESNNNFGFVYFENFKVFGFSFGTKDNSSLFKEPKTLLQLGLSLAKRPFLIKRLISHLSSKSSPSPELAYIAVHPQFRGKGIGKQLLMRQNEAFMKKGITHYEIRVDADNIPSLSLHQKLGAKIETEFMEGSVRRLRLCNNLRP